MIRAVWVEGIPVPQGSMKGYVRGNRAILTSDNPKLKNWRKSITFAASQANIPKLEGPVRGRVAFFLPRPKSAPKRVIFPVKKPDLDKLVRAVGDGLSDAGVWGDDSQVVDWMISKRFASDEFPVGAYITLEEVNESEI